MAFWSRKERDPVCGMEVDRKKVAATGIHKDVKYYFCSIPCKVAFSKKPKRYVKAPVAAAVGAAGGSCH